MLGGFAEVGVNLLLAQDIGHFKEGSNPISGT